MASAMFITHLVYTILLFGVNTTSGRGIIHCGLWGIKIFILLLSFFIFLQLDFKHMISMFYIGCVCRSIWLIVKGLFIVDKAHRIGESMLRKSEKNPQWLIWMTLWFIGMNLLSFGMLGYLLYNYEDQLSRYVVLSTMIIVVVIQILSVLPYVRETNPDSNITQSSFLGMYLSNIIRTSITISPHSVKGILQEDIKFENFSRLLSVLLSLIFVCYSAFSTTKNTKKLLLDREVDQDPPYSLFHAIMTLASANMAVIITYFKFPVYDEVEDEYIFEHKLNSGYWINTASVWIIALLYVWTLFAPRILTNRSFAK